LRGTAFARSEDAVGAKAEGSPCRADAGFGGEAEPSDERRSCARASVKAGPRAMLDGSPTSGPACRSTTRNGYIRDWDTKARMNSNNRNASSGHDNGM
jgi:hypothetical protein